MTSGVGLPIDVVTAETSKSQAILELNLARDNAQQAKVALLGEMGVDPLTPINVQATEEPLYDVASPKPLLKIALRRRPEIRAAEQAVLASRYGLSAAKTVDFPSVYAAWRRVPEATIFPERQHAEPTTRHSNPPL